MSENLEIDQKKGFEELETEELDKAPVDPRIDEFMKGGSDEHQPIGLPPIVDTESPVTIDAPRAEELLGANGQNSPVSPGKMGLREHGNFGRSDGEDK